MSALSKQIGARMQQARKNAGLTQDQVGKQVFVCANLISFWETGKREPKLDYIHAYAVAVGVPMAYFFER